MKNKKAQGMLLGEHSVELIIAVLSIAVLIFLGVYLYNFFVGNEKELEQAQATLEKIKGTADTLEAAGESASILIEHPTDWYISSWPYKVLIGRWVPEAKEYPSQCNNKPCLCICKKGSNDAVSVSAFKGCEDSREGRCINLDREIIVQGSRLQGGVNVLKLKAYDNFKVYYDADGKIKLERV